MQWFNLRIHHPPQLSSIPPHDVIPNWCSHNDIHEAGQILSSFYLKILLSIKIPSVGYLLACFKTTFLGKNRMLFQGQRSKTEEFVVNSDVLLLQLENNENGISGAWISTMFIILWMWKSSTHPSFMIWSLGMTPRWWPRSRASPLRS